MVKAGQVVRVRVVEVDVKRKRISLSMRRDASQDEPKAAPATAPNRERSKPTATPGNAPLPSQGAFGAALASALKRN